MYSKMCDDLNKEIEAENVVIVVLLDLSAAFDNIDHTVLLEKLLKEKKELLEVHCNG